MKSYKAVGIKLPGLSDHTKSNQSRPKNLTNQQPIDIENNDDEDDEIDESFFLPRQRKVYMIKDPIVDDDQHGNSVLEERKTELDNIINELIISEEKFVSNLQFIIDNYSSLDVAGKWSYIAGNIEEIAEEAQKFIESLNRTKMDVNKLAYVFINVETVLTNLMTKYARNLTTSRKYLLEFKYVIQARDKELGKKIGLADDLMLPVKRLANYILLLGRVQKELAKNSSSLNNINSAIDVVKNVMQICDNYVASASIRCDNSDLKNLGSFIMKGEFSVLKPKKFTSLVFLFQNVIIFTKYESKSRDYYLYEDSIQTNNLSVSRIPEENVFHLINYVDSKKSKNKTITYVLQGSNEETKDNWIKEIESLLWEQAKTVKGCRSYKIYSYWLSQNLINFLERNEKTLD